MRRITFICLTLVAAALMSLPAVAGAAPSAGASAKAKSKAKPKITRVQPMRVSVGARLTIRGRNFRAKRRKNTVIFRSNSGRTAFAKPRRASRRKLVLVVPASVARLLNVANSRQRPTRLKLRVLAGRFSKFTPRRLSPVVTGVGDGDGTGGGGGGGGGGAAVCNSDADHDNDLLGNDLELAIGTDPCLEDTDKDQMSDGWEYWSAKDLNISAVPYPGKRPFPNALDPSDGGENGASSSAIDFDGDGLTTLEEYRAWRYTGGSFDMGYLGSGLQSVVGYSDGTKFSRASESPVRPVPDFSGDPAVWRDDERDADADGLGNWLEAANGPGRPGWWTGFWAADARQIKPWKEESYCGERPGEFTERPFADLDLADSDVDGDSVADGDDDQDSDDVSNATELYEVVTDLDGNGQPGWCTYPPGAVPTIQFDGADRAINPFNPCAPDPNSRTCPPYIPFE